ncbi:MAG: hypothetical protein O7F12_06320 [Nitrospirae bacterium]|nr:hypothetical protein [Nitrospirota bacterium]
MERPHIRETLEEMVRVILNDYPGFVKLGNVLFELTGNQLSWDIPHNQWDVDGICHSLKNHAQYHSEVEDIAIGADAYANL